MRRMPLILVATAALSLVVTSSCKESDCDKFAGVIKTCLRRYCQAGGAGTAQCECVKNKMVLAGWTAAPCNDGLDNDGDGFTDCADPDCWQSESCLCNDGVDNDDDDLTDCEDPDCVASVHCCSVRERAAACCFDGLDNDGDGFTDCEEDPDCARSSDCCQDGIDNDGDGLTDCQDPECAGHPACCSSAGQQLEACNCSDGVDNDGDSLTDCQDDDCHGDPLCWDPRNKFHSERIPYCMDEIEGMSQACHSSKVDELMESFDCQATTARYDTGLPGEYDVEAQGRSVDLGMDLHVDEETAETLIFGPDPAGNEVDLGRITFYDDGWFSSNISEGYWDVKESSTVVLTFLSDDCLGSLDTCDISRATVWRRNSAGTMRYTLMVLPQGGSMRLGSYKVEDTNSDDIDDLVLRYIQLDRN